MKYDRVAELLLASREQSEQMVTMYRESVIPKAVAEMNSHETQLREHMARIVEIDALMATFG